MKKEDFFSTETIGTYHTQSDGMVPSIRDINFSVDELMQLASLHKDQPYVNDIYQLLAAHPHANDALHRKLISLSTDWHSVVDAISTSGLASTELLNNLLERGADRFEELHIRLALFAHQLKETLSTDYDKLLDSVTGDDDFSIAARDQIAQYAATPNHILSILTSDDYDHVAESAMNTLQAKLRKQQKDKLPD